MKKKEAKYPIPIREWSEDDRPREKLLKYGEHTLSNAELLAIMIRTGHQEKAQLMLEGNKSANSRMSLKSISYCWQALRTFKPETVNGEPLNPGLNKRQAANYLFMAEDRCNNST